MHEISLCMSALELIEEQARQHGAQQVSAVWMEIGALSCIEESALRFSFDAVCRQTVAQGCRLHLSYRPARAWCWNCSQSIFIDQHNTPCPHCGSYNLRVESGESLRIRQIEVQ